MYSFSVILPNFIPLFPFFFLCSVLFSVTSFSRSVTMKKRRICRIKPTIQSIARVCGVSRGTVDGVLNDRPYVSADVRKKHARRAGYRICPSA